MSSLKKGRPTNYCPSCLNDSLSLNSRGVVEIVVNGKKMDAGHFLFNLGKDSQDELLDNFKNKLEEFFRWYGTFQNKAPITNVDIISSDFSCENKCRLELGYKGSVIEILIPANFLNKCLKEFSQDYGLTLNL